MKTERNCGRLVEFMKLLNSCAVALSGGVDSAVVCKATKLALGDRCLAVTADSASVAASELEQAREIAALIGIRHEILKTDELSNPDYARNDANRCYHCKTELYSRIRQHMAQWNVVRIVNGTNLDDKGDHRPGMIAAKELHVISPLLECSLGKAEIREMARFWELPVHDKPASPCLSSRVAYGESVTPERLAMIEQAEAFLREQGFFEFRVRYHGGDLARVELSVDDLSALADAEFRQQLIDRFLEIGFRFVTLDLQGFRSGNLNQLISSDVLRSKA